MEKRIAVTAIGPDRAGLIRDLSGIVTEAAGNILESRMIALGSEFAILMLVGGNWASIAKIRERLEAACQEGGTTFFTSGFDPGWSGDVIPLALAAASERVDSIRVSELMDYSTYEDPGFTGVYFGYGRPLDYPAPLLQPGMLKGGWGGMVVMLADALGVDLDEIREELATELMGLEVARTENRAIADRIADAIRNGASLEDAARAEQLTLQRSDRLQRRPDGYIPDLGASEAVMAAAFNMQPGQSSDRVFEVDGAMVLIQVMDRYAPDEAAIEAAIDQERTLLASQKQQAYLTTWIDQARTQLAEDNELIVNLAALRSGR